MKREQIEKEIDARLEEPDNDWDGIFNSGYSRGFREGAQWRINAVWHKKHTVIPDVGRPALLELIDPGSHKIVYKIDSYSGYEWKELTHYEHAGLVRFAYIDDLLPERKEETE